MLTLKSVNVTIYACVHVHVGEGSFMYLHQFIRVIRKHTGQEAKVRLLLLQRIRGAKEDIP